MKIFSFTPIAKKSNGLIEEDAEEIEAFNGGGINVNPGVTKSTNFSHLILLIVPLIALAVYGIMSRRAYNNSKNKMVNNIQYTKVSTVERPNYGSL